MPDLQRYKECRKSGTCWCGDVVEAGKASCTKCLTRQRERSKAYHNNNLAAANKESSEYYFNHREALIEKRKAYSRKLRAEVLDAYGNKCACCGETEAEFLQVDHKDNLGSGHRKTVGIASVYGWLRRNAFPKDNYQLLCANCNWSKGRWGYCPHTKSLKSV